MVLFRPDGSHPFLRPTVHLPLRKDIWYSLSTRVSRCTRCPANTSTFHYMKIVSFSWTLLRRIVFKEVADTWMSPCHFSRFQKVHIGPQSNMRVEVMSEHQFYHVILPCHILGIHPGISLCSWQLLFKGWNRTLVTYVSVVLWNLNNHQGSLSFGTGSAR